MPRKIKGLRCLFPLKPNRLLFQWSRVSNKRLFKKWSCFGWNKLSSLRAGGVWVKLPKPKALIIFLGRKLEIEVHLGIYHCQSFGCFPSSAQFRIVWFPCFVQINDSRIFGSPQQFTFDKLHTLIMLREWSEAQAKVAFGTEEQAIFNTSSDASPTLSAVWGL